MDRANYVDLFSTPDDYKPPDDNELRGNTQYPNLNSRDYRKKVTDRTPKIHKYFEKFSVNDEGNSILAANDIRGRIWHGCVWGFEDIDSVGEETKACFKLFCDSPITNLKYIQNNIFLVSEANGTLRLLSTKSENRKIKDYCLFTIGERSEHIGIILAMDIMNGTKVITGSSDCCLKIWDTASADLYSIHTMRYAHSDSITGITSTDKMESIFATCSLDKSALLWDYRLPRPATALYDNYKYQFSTIYWSQEEEKNSTIMLGDETGTVYSVDPKMPNQFVDQIQVFDRPIRKLTFHTDKMAVIGNTNVVKVYKCSANNQYEILYKDSEAMNLVRDVYWNPWIENEFYTIDWDGALRKHQIE